MFFYLQIFQIIHLFIQDIKVDRYTSYRWLQIFILNFRHKIFSADVRKRLFDAIFFQIWSVVSFVLFYKILFY